MSPPLLGVGGHVKYDVSLMTSAQSMDCSSKSCSTLKERNYLGLSDCSSVDSSDIPSSSDVKISLNLKATELRLGLPGSQSPERDSELDSMLSSGKLDEKPLFPLLPSNDVICSSSQKPIVSGNKRGFSDTVDGNREMNLMFSNRIAAPQPVIKKEISSNVPREQPHATAGTGSNGNSNPPAAKAQVVGWPPIRSFRKNTLATTSKGNSEAEGKLSSSALLVKVSMDGAPYLRKVDLRSYSTYQELSSALEKMFSCFTIGQCGSQGHPGRERLSESKLRDLLHGSEYVLTYEDKDGDWMLVGDVPWDMFIDTCKRLKIMKGTDAIGLAPRVMEKSKNRN